MDTATASSSTPRHAAGTESQNEISGDGLEQKLTAIVAKLLPNSPAAASTLIQKFKRETAEVDLENCDYSYFMRAARTEWMMHVAGYFDLAFLERHPDISDESMCGIALVADQLLSRSPIIKEWRSHTAAPGAAKVAPKEALDYSLLRRPGDPDVYLKIPTLRHSDMDGCWFARVATNRRSEGSDEHGFVGRASWSTDKEFVVVAPPPPWKPSPPNFVPFEAPGAALAAPLQTARAVAPQAAPTAIAQLALQFPEAREQLLAEAVHRARTISDSPYSRDRETCRALRDAATALLEKDVEAGVFAADLFAASFHGRSARAHWFGELAEHTAVNRELFVTKALAEAESAQSSDRLLGMFCGSWAFEGMYEPAMKALAGMWNSHEKAAAINKFAVHGSFPEGLPLPYVRRLQSIAENLTHEVTIGREKRSHPEPECQARAMSALIPILPEDERRAYAAAVMNRLTPKMRPYDRLTPTILALPYLEDGAAVQAFKSACEGITDQDHLFGSALAWAGVLHPATRGAAMKFFKRLPNEERESALSPQYELAQVLSAGDERKRSAGIEKLFITARETLDFRWIVNAAPWMTGGERTNARQLIQSTPPPPGIDARAGDLRARQLAELDQPEAAALSRIHRSIWIHVAM